MVSTSTTTQKPRVIVCGGGLVGLYTAHALSRANIDFVVLEQQSEVTAPKGAGLVLFPHVARLLDQLGLYELALKETITITDKQMLRQNGRVVLRHRMAQSIEAQHGYPALGFPRWKFIRLLYDHLPERETRIRTSARVSDIEMSDDGVRVHLEDGSVEEGTLVIGADGVYSRVRDAVNRHAQPASATEKAKEKDPSDTSPMVASFFGIYGIAPYVKGAERTVFNETHGPGMVSQFCAGEDEMIFGLYAALPKPTTLRHKYTEEELEATARRWFDVQVFPGIKFKEIWEKCDRSSVHLANAEEGFIDKWYHGRIVMLGDSVCKMTPIFGMAANKGIECGATLVNELYDLFNSGAEITTASIEKAFQRFQDSQIEDARKIEKRGRVITRLFSWHGWSYWLLDHLVVPWLNMEKITINELTEPVSKAHILDFVPFKGRTGKIPWVRQPKVQA